MTRLFAQSGLFVDLTEEQEETVTGGVDLAALVRDAFYSDPNLTPESGLNQQPNPATQAPQDCRSFQGLTISSLPAPDLQS